MPLARGWFQVHCSKLLQSQFWISKSGVGNRASDSRPRRILHQIIQRKLQAPVGDLIHWSCVSFRCPLTADRWPTPALPCSQAPPALDGEGLSGLTQHFSYSEKPLRAPHSVNQACLFFFPTGGRWALLWVVALAAPVQTPVGLVPAVEHCLRIRPFCFI